MRFLILLTILISLSLATFAQVDIINTTNEDLRETAIEEITEEDELVTIEDTTYRPHRRANYYEAFNEVDRLIDSMVIYKSKRMLQTYHRGEKVKLYMISLGMEPIGKKEFEGDLKTPEGLYSIDKREAISSYHKNLNISYPNQKDSIFAARQGKSAGGEIKIHGFPNNHRQKDERQLMDTDWTLGCIAVTDHEIDELFTWVRNNCPILILP